MRRLAFLVVILAVHCIALFCAAGSMPATSWLRPRVQEPPASQSQPTPTSDVTQNPQVDSQAQPPAESDSTYEQYIRERNKAAASQASSESGPPAPPPVNPFHVQFNVDFTNAYFYRGILQQDHGLIVQPAARLTVNLYQHDDWSIDTILGTWNSFGSNAGSNANTIVSDWYECDLLAGFIVTKNAWSLATTYTFLTSPSDAFSTVQELDFNLGYNDSDLLGKFALHPYALLAIETSSVGSDGSDPGIYLELGVEPGLSFDLGKTPVAVSFPVALGLSLHDYYDFADGDNSTFGFVQAGVNLSMPLPFGERFGSWTLNAGASCMYLGDNIAKINNDDNFEVIGTIGLQWNF